MEVQKGLPEKESSGARYPFSVKESSRALRLIPTVMPPGGSVQIQIVFTDGKRSNPCIFREYRPFFRDSEEMRAVCYNDKPHYKVNAGVKGHPSGFSGV